MFTLDQIHQAHALVKTGADFPTFLNTIKRYGVLQNKVFVTDGTATYLGANNFTLEDKSIYTAITVQTTLNSELFKTKLKAHQKGETDFLTFCKDCADTGIAYWIIDTEKMSCTYYDLANNEVLKEMIPQ